MGIAAERAVASTFSAMLELARDGRVAVRQMTPFGEIYLKRCERGSRGGQSVNRMLNAEEAKLAELAAAEFEQPERVTVRRCAD